MDSGRSFCRVADARDGPDPKRGLGSRNPTSGKWVGKVGREGKSVQKTQGIWITAQQERGAGPQALGESGKHEGGNVKGTAGKKTLLFQTCAGNYS